MGLLRLFVGLIAGEEADRKEQAERQLRPGAGPKHPLEDTRHRPIDPNQKQIAGEKCRRCKDTIVLQKDGVLCDHCKKPVHGDCLTEHLARCKSRPKDGTAYRG